MWCAMSRSDAPTIAVALHDVEPATFERCALIRDWLYDHGVDRVTLLVIPARDLHPLSDRRPEIGAWLAERVRAGDAVAQHGFQHFQSRPGLWSRPTLPRLHSEAAEFARLDGRDTARALDAGRRILKLAGIEPAGFIAPAYAYTPALREMLGSRFRWWAGSWGLYAADRRPGSGPGRRLSRSPMVSAPAIGLGSASLTRRAISPGFLRAATLLSGDTLRLDLHPRDLTSPSHILTLEWVLRHAIPRRRSVTYDDLASPE
jgi:predicted deacetylase